MTPLHTFFLRKPFGYRVNIVERYCLADIDNRRIKNECKKTCLVILDAALIFAIPIAVILNKINLEN
jgi:hypothetical protein